jgi:predicted MFS family arabinose efflux permease
MGFSFFILAALLIVVLVSREDERAYAIGVVSSGFMFPLLIVPYLSEQIIQRYGFFFFFLAAFSLALIPLLYAFFVRLRLPSYADQSGVESPGFLRLLRRKRVFLIFLLTLLFEICLSSSLSFVPLLAHESSSMRSGYYFTFLGLTAVFMRLYIGRKFRHWGNPLLMIPAFCFISAGGGMIYFSHTNLFLGLAGVVWGVGVGILYPHLSAMVVQGTSAQEKGKVLSLFASSVDLGFALGPLIFGWVSDTLGLRITFVPFALFILLSSSAVIWIGRSSLFRKQEGQD